MRYKKTFLSFFLIIFSATLLVGVKESKAQVTYTPQIKEISGKLITFDNSTKALGNYIKSIYEYGVGIAAIIATVVLMIGGFQWIMAGGSGEKIGEAKAWITAALSGLVIVFASYTLLNLISPNLVNFKIINIASILKIKEVEDTAYLEFAKYKGGQEMVKNFDVFDSQLKKAADDAKIDCNLLKAMMFVESTGNPNATGPLLKDGQKAQGLMQVKPTTARDMDVHGSLYDPVNGLTAGARYIKYLEKYACNGKTTTKGASGFGNVCNVKNIKYVIAAYNGGMNGANKIGPCGRANWECPGELAETKKYVSLVMTNLTNINVNGWGCR